MKKISAPTKILLGMATGVVFGILLGFLPPGTIRDGIFLNGILAVCGTVFLNAFRLIVGPVVFVSLAVGIMSMNNPVVLGRVGLKTIFMYLVTTVAAIGCGLALAMLICPGAGLDVSRFGELAAAPQAAQPRGWAATLIDIVPRNALRAFTDEVMLQILFLAIFTGVALAMLGEKTAMLKRFLEQCNLFNLKIIDLIMGFAPLGVFALMADTFARFGVAAMLPLLKYIACIGAAMVILVLMVYVPLLKYTAHISPWRFFREFFPVMVLGFSTSSSNAALPFNIETLERKIGVSEGLATLVLSLGATINMNGTAIMQGCGALFIAQLYGIPLGATQIAGIVVTAVLASVGTAGVPGAGILMLAMVLQSAGLPLEGIALLMGVDRLVDMMRTVINITGDAICACVVAESEHDLRHPARER